MDCKPRVKTIVDADMDTGRFNLFVEVRGISIPVPIQSEDVKILSDIEGPLREIVHRAAIMAYRQGRKDALAHVRRALEIDTTG
jgi:thiamine phosphate synthase YjbQ (UPF0047 family)